MEEEEEEGAHPSMPSWQLELEQLQVGSMVRVKWKDGNWRQGEVLSILLALYACDAGVHLLYEDGATMCEPLGVMEWEVLYS